MGQYDIVTMLRAVPGILLGFTVHEFLHAYTAYRLGDSTARDEGRLTLNPLKHIDPWGFLLLAVAGFGWAKPVRISPEKFAHPRRDEILVSLAGPLSNLVLAFGLAAILKILLAGGVLGGGPVGYETANVLLTAVFINLGLFVFNMIPIPPLDGSHLYLPFLKSRSEKAAILFYRYGVFTLLGVIILESATKIDILPVGPAVRWLGDLVLTAVGLG
jgi:Zn-dependent protease